MDRKNKVLALDTMDYQNRNGEYPRSDVPDIIRVFEENDGIIVVRSSFKNTSEATAERWTRNKLESLGVEIVNLVAYQDGDYHDDWVGVTAIVKA